MTDAKFTPGPWHVGGKDKATIYDKFDQRIGNFFECVMATQYSDIDCSTNARLAASAPELLKALREIAELCESFDGCPVSPSTIAAKARAAIAKATA